MPSYVTNAPRCQPIPGARPGPGGAGPQLGRYWAARCFRLAAAITRSDSRRSCFSRRV